MPAWDLLKEVTHLEPDILEWEVKWALESITTKKASGEDVEKREPSYKVGGNAN